MLIIFNQNGINYKPYPHMVPFVVVVEWFNVCKCGIIYNKKAPDTLPDARRYREVSPNRGGWGYDCKLLIVFEIVNCYNHYCRITNASRYLFSSAKPFSLSHNTKRSICSGSIFVSSSIIT